MRRTTRFRQLIDQPEILVLPGAHDALSVRLIEMAGFEAFTAGGYAATASLLGAPDIGQLGLAEMADHYARLCDVTPLPVLADADTGYGSPIGVARTIRAYERAGVAALFIEDQVAPKRCGHMDGKRVVPVTEMVAKVKAAVDARSMAIWSSWPGRMPGPSKGWKRPLSALRSIGKPEQTLSSSRRR